MCLVGCDLLDWVATRPTETRPTETRPTATRPTETRSTRTKTNTNSKQIACRHIVPRSEKLGFVWLGWLAGWLASLIAKQVPRYPSTGDSVPSEHTRLLTSLFSMAPHWFVWANMASFLLLAHWLMRRVEPRSNDTNETPLRSKTMSTTTHIAIISIQRERERVRECWFFGNSVISIHTRRNGQ